MFMMNYNENYYYEDMKKEFKDSKANSLAPITKGVDLFSENCLNLFDNYYMIKDDEGNFIYYIYYYYIKGGCDTPFKLLEINKGNIKEFKDKEEIVKRVDFLKKEGIIFYFCYAFNLETELLEKCYICFGRNYIC